MNHDAFRFGISLLQIRNFLTIFGNDLNNRQSEFPSKIEVSAVMRRNTHNSSRPMICQHIIRNPDRKFFPIERVDRIRTGKSTMLFFILHPVYIGFVFGGGHISGHRLVLLRPG